VPEIVTKCTHKFLVILKFLTVNTPVLEEIIDTLFLGAYKEKFILNARNTPICFIIA
jgi:hypothetical protein